MKFKILYIIEQPIESRYYYSLLTWLKNNTELDIYIINICNNDDFKKTIVDLIDKNKYFHIKLNSSYFKAVLPLKKIINEINPNIIHAHVFNVAFYAGLAQLLTFKKQTFIYHKHNDKAFNKKEFLMEFFVMLIAKKVICVSNYVLHNTKKTWFFARKKIDFIYNGIGVNVVNPEIEKSPFSIDYNYVLLLARLRKEKGHLVALNALKILVEKGIPIKMVFAGDGPFRNEIEETIRNFNIEENVSLLGNVYNIENLIAHSDFLIMPSIEEPFGLVAIEALAKKKLIIASAVGGLIEIISDKITGVLFTVNDAKELANKIEYYYKNKFECEQIGEQGYSEYINRFTPEIMSAKYYSLYLSLIKK